MKKSFNLKVLDWYKTSANFFEQLFSEIQCSLSGKLLKTSCSGVDIS